MDSIRYMIFAKPIIPLKMLTPNIGTKLISGKKFMAKIHKVRKEKVYMNRCGIIKRKKLTADQYKFPKAGTEG